MEADFRTRVSCGDCLRSAGGVRSVYEERRLGEPTQAVGKGDGGEVEVDDATVSRDTGGR